MAFNGSGTFVRQYDWTDEAALGNNISSSKFDTEMDDIADALTNCITKDGQTTPTQDIPFGGNKLTGVGDPTSDQDAATKIYVDFLRTQGADITAATTTNIGAATGHYVKLTGTAATITGFGTIRAGESRTVYFNAAHTLTHNATSLILLGGATRVVAAGEIGIYVSEGSGNWRELYFSGQTEIGSGDIADDAITTAKIADDAVTAAKIAAGAVGASEIATGAVGTDEIATGAVDTDELAADAVTTAKIDDGAVTIAKAANPLKAFTSQYYQVEHQESAGTNAGGLTSGSWQTRTLNTEVTDDLSRTLSSNQISLAAGTYYVEAEAAGMECDKHQIRLRNVTDGSTTKTGTAERSDSGLDPSSSKSKLAVRFTIGGTKLFELQHRCETTRASYGMGLACNFGETEVYAVVKIWKIG